MKADDIRAVAEWLKAKTSTREIAYRPARVLMQDFTGVPAVVDLAAMRDAMRHLGGDPSKINPLVPVDLVIDHSVQVDYFGTADAFKKNVEIEYERNKERYEFLRWGAGAFNNFQVVPPGTGICHQVNLEYLAQSVWTKDAGPQDPGVPGYLRRHRQPHHHGQRAGRAGLGRGRHRGRGGHAGPAGGDGDPRGDRLPLPRQAQGGRDRHRPGAHLHADAAQARRGREVRRVLRRRPRQPLGGGPRHHRQHGARVRRHLRLLPGRCRYHQVPEGHRPRAGERVALVEAYCKAQGMWREPGAAPVYTDVLELDLSTVEPSMAGPKRPQDRVPLDRRQGRVRRVAAGYRQGREPRRRSPRLPGPTTSSATAMW